MALTYTYEPAASSPSVVTRIRGEIGDTNVDNGGVDAIFSDQQLMLYYQQEDADFNFTVARIYEVLAGQQALYVGKQSFLNNFVDGVASSVELLKLASERRSQWFTVI